MSFGAFEEPAGRICEQTLGIIARDLRDLLLRPNWGIAGA